MSSVARLFRLNVEVGHLEDANDFYSRLLQQEGRLQMGRRSYFDAGGITLQVLEVAQPHAVPKALYFVVDDLDDAHRRAIDLDCLSEDFVHGTPAGQPFVRPWGERSFYLEDPWGNSLCFVEAGTIYSG